MIRVFEQRAEQTVSGFKPPSDDHLKGRLNIVDRVVIDPHNTFYHQMDSDAMRSSGIRLGDILIIDRSLTAADKAIVIHFREGAFYCRQYVDAAPVPYLRGDIDRLEATNGEALEIWGVVTGFFRGTLPRELRKGRYRRVCTL